MHPKEKHVAKYTKKTKSTRTYGKAGPTKRPAPGGPPRPRTVTRTSTRSVSSRKK